MLLNHGGLNQILSALHEFCRILYLQYWYLHVLVVLAKSLVTPTFTRIVIKFMHVCLHKNGTLEIAQKFTY